jgi:hypothetical protein
LCNGAILSPIFAHVEAPQTRRRESTKGADAAASVVKEIERAGRKAIDLRIFLDLGASRRAADLLIVLRLFLSDYPDARRVSPRWDGWDLIQKSSAPRRPAPRRDEKSIAVRRSPPIDEKGGSKKSPEVWRKSCPCGN